VLGSYLHRHLDEVPGVTVIGPSTELEDRAALLSFVCEQVHPSDLSIFLDMDGVAVCAGHHSANCTGR
jgi:cysteine desulfurase/selenocysteine lyase